MIRFVVYLPPATATRPGTGTATLCSRLELRGRLRLAREQRPQAGVDALDVGVRERLRQHCVGVLEHVVDVGAAGGRVGLVQLPVGVGRADDPVAAPRDHEQDRLLRSQDQPGVELDAVLRDDEVDALGRAHSELAALADEVLEVVGPDAGRVDHLLRADLDLAPRRDVAHAHAGDALALAQEADDRRVGGDRGAVEGGGAGDRQRVAGVVDLRVVVLDAADQRVGLEPRRDPQRLALGQVSVSRHAGVAGHLVVEHHPGADVGPLPDAVLERVEERDRLDEVGRDPRQQQSALAERLAHEAEVELLEVAQAAVDQLAGAAGGARGEVARLDQRHRQAAGGGVERSRGADDAAADHDDLEGLVRHALQRRVALLGIEDAGVVHGVSSLLRW